MFLGIMSQKKYLNRLKRAPEYCSLNHDSDSMLHDFIHAEKSAGAAMSGLKHGTSFCNHVGHVRSHEFINIFRKVGNSFL